jgi:hypothetical protein
MNFQLVSLSFDIKLASITLGMQLKHNSFTLKQTQCHVPESLQEDNVLGKRLFIFPCKSNLNSRSRHELY